jgi:hypothetical protein
LKKGEGPKLGPLTKEQFLAFEALREKLLQPPILAPADVRDAISSIRTPLMARLVVV